ncbi:MAG: hypothetical protein P4M13_11975 [Alphaproteobacteria bacterium]|nr:hypothetical protein [Alphaproteobacteria bacterium]
MNSNRDLMNNRVIPAKAGIHLGRKKASKLDPRLRGDDARRKDFA